MAGSNLHDVETPLKLRFTIMMTESAAKPESQAARREHARRI
jgi:hypothetical protein